MQGTAIFLHANVKLDLAKSLEVKSDHRIPNAVYFFVCIIFCLCLPECTECEDGYFSKSINSPCQRWKQYVHPPQFYCSAQQWPVFPTSVSPFFSCRCKSGVNVTGTKTSDIVCNDEKPQTGNDANVSPIPVKAVASNMTHQPQETVQTQRLFTTTTTRQIQHPEPSPSSTADPLGKTYPSVPVRTTMKKKNPTKITAELSRAVFLVTIATVGLLVLTAIIIKFYVGFYLEKQESVQSM